MKKKVLVSLVLTGSLIVGAAAGTFAYFTSKSISTGNVIQTGILKIEGPGTIKQVLQVEGGLQPGVETEDKWVAISNKGTMPFKYKMYVDPVNSILYAGETPIQVSVNGAQFVSVDKLGYVDLGTIEKGSTSYISIKFKLPNEANNDYQNIGADFTFNFIATQINNNEGIVVEKAGRIYDTYGSISEKYTDIELKFNKDVNYSNSQWEVSYWTKTGDNYSEIVGSNGTTVRKNSLWDNAWVNISDGTKVTYGGIFKAGIVYGTAINSNAGSAYAKDDWWNALYVAQNVYARLVITDEAGITTTTYCKIK